MEIKKDDVKHVAELARIEFSEEDIEEFTKQLGNILNYISKLNELNTSNVEPTSHVLDESTPLRDDIVEDWLSKDEVLKNAPKEENGFFVVPKIIDE